MVGVCCNPRSNHILFHSSDSPVRDSEQLEMGGTGWCLGSSHNRRTPKIGVPFGVPLNYSRRGTTHNKFSAENGLDYATAGESLKPCFRSCLASEVPCGQKQGSISNKISNRFNSVFFSSQSGDSDIARLSLSRKLCLLARSESTFFN